MLGTIILMMLAVLFFGVLPIWPYSKHWGYKGAGIVTIMIILCLIAIFLGKFDSGTF
jgi:hypothetical protein